MNTEINQVLIEISHFLDIYLYYLVNVHVCDNIKYMFITNLIFQVRCCHFMSLYTIVNSNILLIIIFN